MTKGVWLVLSILERMVKNEEIWGEIIEKSGGIEYFKRYSTIFMVAITPSSNC